MLLRISLWFSAMTGKERSRRFAALGSAEGQKQVRAGRGRGRMGMGVVPNRSRTKLVLPQTPKIILSKPEQKGHVWIRKNSDQ